LGQLARWGQVRPYFDAVCASVRERWPLPCQALFFLRLRALHRSVAVFGLVNHGVGAVVAGGIRPSVSAPDAKLLFI
jgi:hypothetical protein